MRMMTATCMYSIHGQIEVTTSEPMEREPQVVV
jgi:hypothetical protein